MTEQEMLSALKIDLGYKTNAYDERLKAYIKSAKVRIKKEGITLSCLDIDHCNVIIMYAAWMWRRRDTGEGMPRMLRYELNQMVFSQKAGEADG